MIGSTFNALERDLVQLIPSHELIVLAHSEAETFGRSMGLFEGNCSALASTLKCKRPHIESVDGHRNLYVHQKSKYDARKQTYDQGNALVKALSFIERGTLEGLEKGLAAFDQEVRAEERSLGQELESFGGKVARLAAEQAGLAVEALAFIDRDIAERRQNIENQSARAVEASAKAEILSWVPEAVANLEVQRQRILAALKRDLERSELLPKDAAACIHFERPVA